MAQFESAQRRETHIFQELFQENGQPVWRRMQFNLVQYDGDSDRYIEPRPASDFFDGISVEPRVHRAVADGIGVIAGMEFYQARPFRPQAFNDGIDT